MDNRDGADDINVQIDKVGFQHFIDETSTFNRNPKYTHWNRCYLLDNNQ